MKRDKNDVNEPNTKNVLFQLQTFQRKKITTTLCDDIKIIPQFTLLLMNPGLPCPTCLHKLTLSTRQIVLSTENPYMQRHLFPPLVARPHSSQKQISLGQFGYRELKWKRREKVTKQKGGFNNTANTNITLGKQYLFVMKV